MEQVESLREFYERKFNWIPENLSKDWGHFNVFQLDPYIVQELNPYLTEGEIFTRLP